MPKVTRRKYKHLFDEFHSTLNGKVRLEELEVTSRKFVFWKCQNKYCQNDWKDTVWGRTLLERGCPKCQKKRKDRKINDRFYIQKDWDEFKKICDEIDVFLNNFTSEKKVKKHGTNAKVRFMTLRKIGKKVRRKISEQSKYNEEKIKEQKKKI